MVNAQSRPDIADCAAFCLRSRRRPETRLHKDRCFPCGFDKRGPGVVWRSLPGQHSKTDLPGLWVQFAILNRPVMEQKVRRLISVRDPCQTCLHPDNSHPYGDCQEAWIRKTEAPGSDRPLRRSRRFPSSFCEAILKRYNLVHPPLCDLARVARIPPSAPDVRIFVTNRGHGGGNAAPMPTPALARVHDNQCCQGL
jgi:hypothetical protein